MPTRPEESPAIPHLQPLALRLAHRNRLRALRAERLAAALAQPDAGGARPQTPERLLVSPLGRGPGRALGPKAQPERTPVPADPDAAAALDDFLRALAGGGGPMAVRPAPGPAPLRETAGPCDLERLPGAGPGLVWALRRAGVPDLAALAACAPAPLAERLGPIGRLIDLEAWTAFARARVGGG